MTSTPYIDLVPKDPLENLRWRVRWREAAMEDVLVREAFRQAAFEDVLFWFNAFCWCFEPRATVKIKPFVTWPHQDPVILAMDRAIDDSERLEEPLDVVVNKSRGQGATWLYLLVFLRRWLRDRMFMAGLVTRTEDLADSATDSDALLWKVAWMIERLPFWMLPQGFELSKHRKLSDHTIVNPELKSAIVGYASTGDVARGGRKTVFGIDEIGAKEFMAGGTDYAVMDSLQHVTNCRFLVSTFGGDSGAFHEAVTEENNAIKLTLDWRDNPTQNRLAYRMTNGVLVAVRPEEQEAVDRYAREHAEDLKKLERRGYLMEGKFRSPWYDAQCLRPGATPRSIAKELDMDPRGTVGKVFSTEVLDDMKTTRCRPPVWRGKVIFDNETLEVKGLFEQPNGPLKLWFRPGVKSTDVPGGKYVVGCDISAGGTGDYSSNSVASGVNLKTGEQVMEYAVLGMMATKFARLCVALSKWLNNSYLVWEASGPTGTAFGKEVLEVIYYANVYYRDVEEVGQRAKTRKPGWWNGSDDDKGELFESLCLAMESGDFIPRSEDLIRECGEYEWDGGKIVHRPSKKRKIDGKSHGDRCVAAGVAWLGCRDRPSSHVDREEESFHDAPYGSLAWRLQTFGQRDRELEDALDYTIHDLVGSY